jgi:hypothetical protein
MLAGVGTTRPRTCISSRQARDARGCGHDERRRGHVRAVPWVRSIPGVGERRRVHDGVGRLRVEEGEHEQGRGGTAQQPAAAEEHPRSRRSGGDEGRCVEHEHCHDARSITMPRRGTRTQQREDTGRRASRRARARAAQCEAAPGGRAVAARRHSRPVHSSRLPHPAVRIAHSMSRVRNGTRPMRRSCVAYGARAAGWCGAQLGCCEICQTPTSQKRPRWALSALKRHFCISAADSSARPTAKSVSPATCTGPTLLPTTGTAAASVCGSETSQPHRKETAQKPNAPRVVERVWSSRASCLVSSAR